MRVIIFGATGMVGQGVLRECLLDSDVENVLVVGRTPTGLKHEKLREILHQDFLDYSAIYDQFPGCDTCFFCLGVSSAGMSEEHYHFVTYKITMAAAETLARLPNMTFVYVSGMGSDSSERGRTMWARVKGQTENALLRLPFKAAYMFRPAIIQPLHGIKSKTKLYRAFYAVLWPIFPLCRAAFPKYVTTTEQVGRAMIKAAQQGFSKAVLENYDINNI